MLNGSKQIKWAGLVFRIGLLSVLAIAVSACGPQLRRADLDAKAVDRERSEQLRLARELRYKRKRRLNVVATRLAPEARRLCKELLDRGASGCTYEY